MALEFDLPLPKYSIRVNDRASSDLEAIISYIAENDNSYSAIRHEKLIFSKIRKLNVFPYGYSACARNPDLRVAHAKQYKIFFKINKKTKTVTVVRIVHSKRRQDN